MNVQTARALSHGDTSLHERMLLAISSDQEWFVVELGGRIRLVPASGGRPTGVTGPIESFSPAPAREQRQAWPQEGALLAEIELGRRANVSVPVVAPVSSVLPLCAFHRVLSKKLLFEKTTVVHRSALGALAGEETVLFAWHPRHELPEQQALYRVQQLVRDDPTLQARIEEMTPQVDLVSAVMPDALCLEVMTHYRRRERSWEEVVASCQEIPMVKLPIKGPRSALWVVCDFSDAVSLQLTWKSANMCKMLRFLSLAGTYDQLDLGNPPVIEVIARRVELTEYQYWERSREGLHASGLGTGASAALTEGSGIGR